MKKNLLCVAIAALSTFTTGQALAAPQNSELPTNQPNTDTQLKKVVVSASRIEEQVDESLASVTVLDRQDIEMLQAKDFRELIAHVPGVDISTSGAPGSTTSLFMRGTNSRHTLFLIDGQRVSSATTGTTNFQFLDPSQIERIEVVRGPKSSLYGSDAIGGVIHIFTRKAQQNKSSAYASGGAGARNSYQANAGGQTHYNNWRASANLSYSETNGFSNAHSNRPVKKDDDGYRNSSASANIGYDFSSTSSLDISHLYVKARNESDEFDELSTIRPYSDNWIQTTSGLFKTQILPFWKMTLSASRNTDDSDYFGSFPSDVRTTSKSSSLQNDFTLSTSHTITIGGDYAKDEVNGGIIFEDSAGKEIKDRDNKGGFIQYIGQFGILDTQLGARHDDSDTYGSHKTENAAVGINFPENHKVIFSYGTAFQAPSFNQLYYPGFGTSSLKPERSKNYEVEFRGNYDSFSWSANFFQNKVSDLIQNIGYNPPQNIAKARINGSEIIVNTKLDEWLISTSLAYVDPRDEDTDTLLINRSRRSVKFDADRNFGKWSVGTSLRAQDERYTNKTNTAHLGGYGLVDIRGGYDFSNALGVQLKLTNIFDKRYELNNNYNTERFGWFATVTYRLQ